MIVWVDSAHDPAENMRRDQALLESAEATGPVLRLFAFRPHGITLGHAQEPARELDLERCRADGIPWAVRPTGGRAIFHAEEWTYALAAPIADPDWGGSLAEAYDRASRLICGALVRLGVPARLAAAATSRDAGPSPRGLGAPPCFASTARHEIVLEGRKLVGSAQRRTAGALLQQGSVLLGPGHLRLADYVSGDARRQGATRRALARAATDAGRWIAPGTPLGRWADALLPGLPDGATVTTHAPGGALRG